MEIILILTIIAIFISVYQLLPEYEKSKRKFIFGKKEKTILICFLIIIIILYLSFLFLEYNPKFSILTISGLSIEIKFIIDLIYMASLIFLSLWIIYKFRKNEIKSKDKFLSELERLVSTDDYYTAIKLIKKNLPKALRTKNKDFQYRFKRFVLREEFIKNLIKIDPYMGLYFIKQEWAIEFFKIYLRFLLSDKNSVLYEEIKNNKNLIGPGNRYSLDKDNKIIYTLFSDISVAEKLEIWRPIGESAIELLNIQNKLKEDEYNDFDEDFNEFSNYPSVYSDRLFDIIRLFDIMVLEAIHQKKEWHMWLFYYQYFVKYICKNYKINEFSRIEEENPNRYSNLLSEIVSNLDKWIRETDKNPELNYFPENINSEYANGDIIKSSIICLSIVHKEIINSKNIPDKFKHKITHEIYKLYFDLLLSENPASNKYAKVILLCLKDRIKNYSKPDKQFKSFLLNSLQTFDKIPIQFNPKGSAKLKEFEKEIENA